MQALRLASILTLLAAPAAAQLPEYALRISPQDAITIVNQLANGPWNAVNPVIAKVQAQIAAQNQAAADAQLKAAVDAAMAKKQAPAPGAPVSGANEN